MASEIVLVISNKVNVEGLIRAERAGIPTKVSHFIHCLNIKHIYCFENRETYRQTFFWGLVSNLHQISRNKYISILKYVYFIHLFNT